MLDEKSEKDEGKVNILPRVRERATGLEQKSGKSTYIKSDREKEGEEDIAEEKV